jgi:hypothetical protein
MGTSIHSFAEYADEGGKPTFSGSPDEPAWFFGQFSLSRDYALFDALGDGRNSQMAPEDVGQRALFASRSIPADISLETAWHYYDLVVESETPHPSFWPTGGSVSVSQAEERVRRGKAHYGKIVQKTHYGATAPRVWRVVSKEYWHTPSWLQLAEIRESLKHHCLVLGELPWDFRVALECLAKIEEGIAPSQVRLVFWFDN